MMSASITSVTASKFSSMMNPTKISSTYWPGIMGCSSSVPFERFCSMILLPASPKPIWSSSSIFCT
jgi:hypothetical protein